MAKVDWAAVETLLVGEATRRLAAFAAEHVNDVFYGAVLDVESYDGCHVHLLLNTEAHLVAEHGSEVPADDLHTRFLPGAFAHTLELSESSGFPAEAIEALVEADIDRDRETEDGLHVTTARLLEVACAVGLALEQGGFAAIRRTPDFAISVTPDPSEPGELGLARYAKYRRAVLARRRSDPALLRPRKPGL